MKRKMYSVKNEKGEVYYAWTMEELAAKLKILVSLYQDAAKYKNRYLNAKEKGNIQEMKVNKVLAKNTKEKIEEIIEELKKDY
jgi:soluble P-type ATPase